MTTSVNEYIKITKEFTVKEDTGFRLRVRMWKCLSPSNLNSVEFINECLAEDGTINFDSVYNFFMTDEEVARLCRGLAN